MEKLQNSSSPRLKSRKKASQPIKRYRNTYVNKINPSLEASHIFLQQNNTHI